MDLALEKKKLIDSLNAVEDISLKPFSTKEFIARINAAEEDIKNERLTSLKDFRKEIKNW